MVPTLPPIIGYHPEIQVDKGGERHVLKMTVDDFEPDEQLLRRLAEAFEVRTVGEVIEKLSGPKTPWFPMSVVRAVVEVVKGVAPHKVGQKVWGWDDKLTC
jgi:hypothetical protein